MPYTRRQQFNNNRFSKEKKSVLHDQTSVESFLNKAYGSLLVRLVRTRCSHLISYVIINYTHQAITYKRVTPPSPLAYCVPPYFGLAYCVPPFLASRTAYRLTTKTTILGVSIYIKKLKLQYVVCTCTVILENISF